MNRRDYKRFTKGEMYHVYNRGVNKMDIFKKEEDYKVFMFRLREAILPSSIDPKVFSKSDRRRKIFPDNSFHLISYCLMPNHFHLLVRQITDLPITDLMSKICTGYSKYFNKEYGRVGAVFQDQFKAVPIEDNHQFLWTSFYIHKNPIESGLVSDLQKYKWNSFIEYFDPNTKDGLCEKKLIQEQFLSSGSYLDYFDKKEEEGGTSLRSLFFNLDDSQVQ